MVDTEKLSPEFGVKLYTALTMGCVYSKYVGRREFVTILFGGPSHRDGVFFKDEDEQRMFAQFVNLSEGKDIVPL